MKRLFWVFGVVSLWSIVFRLQLISPLYLPNPLAVAGAWRPSLLSGAGATLGRGVLGFTLGVALAYSLHFVSVLLQREAAFQEQFAASRAVPVIAALPLFVIWFGFGEFGRTLLVTMTATVFFAAPLQDSYALLGREWTMLREQCRLNAAKYYVHIVLPGTLASLLGAFRVTASVAFTVAVACEYMGAQSGLGRFIDSARVTFNVPAIFLALLVASVLGVTFDFAIRTAHAKVVHWAGTAAKF